MIARLVAVICCAAAPGLGLVACGEDETSPPESGSPTSFAAQAAHIHGLGINPADGALYIATHSGLFRAKRGAVEPEQVGTSTQDTMGFTVAGRDRFFGSGHPAPDQPGPPHLGLIESRDAGDSWRSISLAGEADFHVLRHVKGKIYGYSTLTGQLMTSSDNGTSWKRASPPAPIFDLAVDPEHQARIVAASEAGLVSYDGNWKRLGPEVGLLAWPTGRAFYLVDQAGTVSLSDDGGRSWAEKGQLPEAPVALLATSADELYVALQSGTVMRSTDGGNHWRVRVDPSRREG